MDNGNVNLGNLRTNEDVDLLIELLKNEIKETTDYCDQQKELLNKFHINPECFEHSVKVCLKELSQLQYDLYSLNGNVTDLNLCAINEGLKESQNNRIVMKMKHALKTINKENERAHRFLQQIDTENKKKRSNEKEYSKIMRDKIKKYTSTLKSLQNQFPNCKSSNFDVKKILEEINVLENLQAECNQLSKEMAKYQGLSTNLSEAKIQLRDAEEKCDSL